MKSLKSLAFATCVLILISSTFSNEVKSNNNNNSELGKIIKNKTKNKIKKNKIK